MVLNRLKLLVLLTFLELLSWICLFDFICNLSSHSSENTFLLFWFLLIREHYRSTFPFWNLIIFLFSECFLFLPLFLFYSFLPSLFKFIPSLSLFVRKSFLPDCSNVRNWLRCRWMKLWEFLFYCLTNTGCSFINTRLYSLMPGVCFNLLLLFGFLLLFLFGLSFLGFLFLILSCTCCFIRLCLLCCLLSLILIKISISSLINTLFLLLICLNIFFRLLFFSFSLTFWSNLTPTYI